MKRVIIIGPNVGIGGVERASATLSNEFAAKEITTSYLALITDEKFYPLDSRITYICPEKQRNRYKLDIFYTLKYIRANVREINPDAILVFTKFYAALANLALFGSKYRIFVTERSSPLYRWPFKVELFSKISFFLKKPKGVISQTSMASDFHRKYYGKSSYTIIPNALRELTNFPELKRELTILAVGRFNDPCKGFDLLVQAFNLTKNEDWKLLFAGGTAEEGKYLLGIATENKKSRIHFLGQVKEIDRQYAKAGIFVIPSRSEGFPNALCEAMAAGCPVISFDFVAGPRDIIKDGIDGIIIPKEDISALAQTIDELIADEQKRILLSKNALKIHERLAAPKIAQQYLEFLLS